MIATHQRFSGSHRMFSPPSTGGFFISGLQFSRQLQIDTGNESPGSQDRMPQAASRVENFVKAAESFMRQA